MSGPLVLTAEECKNLGDFSVIIGGNSVRVSSGTDGSYVVDDRIGS